MSLINAWSTPMSVHAIRFDRVTKSFDGRRVLDRVSFDVARGKACCIMGRSGSGKSVTLKLLLGLLKPDEGEIYVNDVQIEALDSARLVEVRKTIGFLFQYSALFDSLSVAENVAFPLRRHTSMSEAEIAGSVHERLAGVGLEDELDKMPLDLSGGMRKRVGLARALALKPSILLVDEPSSGLDPITTREIDKLLIDLKSSSNTTMVVVTHNVPSARRIGDQLVVLHEGHIIAQGTAKELDQSEDEVVRQFMSSEDERTANASPMRSVSAIGETSVMDRSHQETEVEYGVHG
jgi:phospholipid/cholesterol/gamma-HCH transport system ATP-binding protein